MVKKPSKLVKPTISSFKSQPVVEKKKKGQKSTV